MLSLVCLYITTTSAVSFNDLNPLPVSRELLEALDPSDLLAKMEQGEDVVRLALLVALVRLVLLDLQDPLERRDLLALMEPL